MKRERISKAQVSSVVVKGSTTKVLRTSMLKMLDGDDSIICVVMGVVVDLLMWIKC